MKHIYQKGDGHTLILLHGTGGDENDLIPLAKMVSPQSSILSIRGNVLENGMPRFFRRLAIGVFDQENLKEETQNLYHFLLEAAQTYQFDLNKSTIIGFSNGANIAISLLFTYNSPVGQAILLRPMIPNEVILSKSLNQTDVIIISGNYDTIVPPAHGQRLTTLFQGLLANTTLFQLDATHRLTEEDVKIIKDNIKK